MTTVSRTRLPAAVILLGITSFFADVGSDMIFPLLPLFLTQNLRASLTFLGLVEGIADALASILKLASGAWSDRISRRKPLVVVGYGVAAVARPLLSVAAMPWHVLAVRAVDRIGKGTRSAPRDALIAESVDPSASGRAFGFHRALDHAGAVVGPLIASLLLATGSELRTVFLAAAVPSALSIFSVLLVREAPRQSEPVAAVTASKMPRRLTTLLGILLLFSLGNSSDAFLLLRARDLGVPEALIPALWTLLHVIKMASAYGGGILSDRWSRPKVIAAGWIVYAATYLGLGAAPDAIWAWLLFPLYGTFYGLTEPGEKALVRELSPPDLKGSAFGWYNFVVGASALPASLLTGWLWQSFGPATALSVGAAFAVGAVLLLGLWARTATPHHA